MPTQTFNTNNNNLQTKPKPSHSAASMEAPNPQQLNSCISMTQRITSTYHHNLQTKSEQLANLQLRVRMCQIFSIENY